MRTPTGLDAENHYTTAHDLALIAATALENPTFARICSTQQRVIPWETGEWDRLLTNKNRLLTELPGCTGVKTGYTKKAGRCLVASASRDGMQLVAVTLNCGPMFEDCTAMLEYGFDMYRADAVPAGAAAGYRVGERRRGSPRWRWRSPDADQLRPALTADERSRLKTAYELAETVDAPVPDGAVLGEMRCYLDGELLGHSAHMRVQRGGEAPQLLGEGAGVLHRDGLTGKGLN